MVFNVLIGNTDDHLKNHGFLHTGGYWRLAPAFDLLPQPGVLNHAIGVGDAGTTGSIANALSRAARFGLTPREAARIADQLSLLVHRHWPFSALGIQPRA